MIHQYDARGVPRRTGEDADYAALSSNAWADYGDYPGSLRQKGTQWEGQSLTLNFAKHMFSQTVRVSYLYDDAGRLTQKTDPRGVVTTMSYDDLNRPLSVDYSDSTPSASYTYDQGAYGIGRLSTSSNSVATTSYTYDKMGRTLQQDKTIGGNAFSMSWAYNAGGLATSYTLPNGTTISQTFDNLGRPTSITSDWVDADHPATLASNFVYHPTGALTSIAYGNGTASTRSYTSGGLLKTLQHGTPSDPGELLDFEYDYQEGIANTGQIMGITDYNDSTKSQTYSYDEFHRLLTAETDGNHWGLSWGYDRYGNRLSQTVTKGTAPSQSLSIDSQSNRVTGWAYDQAGNTLNDGSHSYAFDANNRTASLDGGSAAYRYDAGGGRVQKVTASQTTSYFFGVAEHVTGLGWSKLYIKLGQEKLVEYSGSTTHFFHVDHRYTPRVRTDVSGSSNQAWDDLPFGESWLATGGGNDQHRLSGHMRDSESDNDHAGARHYSSQEGRWLGVDSSTGSARLPQSRNRFSYVLNDPINLIDPDGRSWVTGCQQRMIGYLPGSDGVEEYLETCGFAWVPEDPEGSERRGGGGGGGPQEDSLESSLRELQTQLFEILSDPDDLSPDCLGLFSSLGVDLGAFREKLRTATIRNGTGSPNSFLYLDLSPEWRPLALQHLALFGLPDDATLGDFLSEHEVTIQEGDQILTATFRPGGIAVPGTNTIYVRENYGDDNRYMGLIAHEVFHLMGIVGHQAFKNAWGIDVSNFDSGSIGDHFVEKCVK